jgi:hypothetical protein
VINKKENEEVVCNIKVFIVTIQLQITLIKKVEDAWSGEKTSKQCFKPFEKAKCSYSALWRMRIFGKISIFFL